MADIRIDRRRFLAGLLSLGAAVALPRPIEAATPVEIDEAWEKLARHPWTFKVGDRTIVDEAFEEPKLWGDAFDGMSAEWVDESEIEACPPLLSHLQSHADDRFDDLQETLERLSSEAAAWPKDRKKVARLAELRKISTQLESDDDRWKAWIALEGRSALEAVVQEWLDSPLDWSQSEWFPDEASAQGLAYKYFLQMDGEILDALGVVIVEGDHPGSTYFAAELRQPLDEANEAAAKLGLPFRFADG